ncbi:hypothetical protein K8352_11930 [Flavobacteriaceae bacterium F89]|uniref:DUF6883 domain-containing protein n=1 Tax=Cerina litoralis TaxID=2874477 RepID=A0AAE3JPW1_9FLAO|nr:DUF6883 domain-containing protein [Cerina litoralis]MCG2461461.1 hypothetical protein [Cerina litoralis]
MPNNTEAVVDANKITDYLLSDTHEIGKHKAKFFKSFGFDENSPTIFEEALKTHAVEREIVNNNDSPFGTKYKLECDIETPDERNPCIVSVWIIENDMDEPRLITAYPAK